MDSGQIEDDEDGLSGISVDPTPVTLTKHNSQIAAVALFENGSKVAAFGRDQLISLWDVSRYELFCLKGIAFLLKDTYTLQEDRYRSMPDIF